MNPFRSLFTWTRAALAALLLAAPAARADTFFVADSGKSAVSRITTAGTTLTPFSSGSLSVPTAIALDSSNNIYLTNDATSSVIEKYAIDGTDLGTFASTNLTRTYGLAFDSAGNLYAANFGNSTIEKFSSTGTDLGAFVSTGISGPVGLAFDTAGNLYVANYSANTVGKFSSTGANLGTFASTGLSIPYAIAFDAAGNLYVSNSGTNTVRKFSAAGQDLGDFVAAGILDQPTGLVFDSAGNLYVTNEDNATIHKFSATGQTLGVFARTGSGSAPVGIARLVSNSPGTLQFTNGTPGTTESSGSLTVYVSRLGGSTGAVTVDCSTVDGSALAGTDYKANSKTLSWPDGDTSLRALTIPIIDRHLSAGSPVFSVELTNPTGGATVGDPAFADVTISDNDAATQPTITITSPPNGLTVVSGTSVPFAANVLDPSKLLAEVQIFLGTTPIYTTTGSGPYVYTVPGAEVLPGNYTVTAVATDSEGRTSSSQISVTVIAKSASATAPVASVLTPVGGLNLKAGATVKIALTALADASTSLDHVNLYANGELVTSFDASGNPLPDAAGGNVGVHREDASGLTNIFQTSYSLPGIDQLINMIAVAFDKLGQTTVSTVASFHATVTTDRAPTVAFTNLGSTVQVAAGATEQADVSASDPDATSATAAAALAAAGSAHFVTQDTPPDAVIAELTYFFNGVNIGSSIQPPYAFNFDAPTAGKYLLHAVATDGAGLSTISAPVTVVAVAPPTVTVAIAGDGMAVEGGEKGKAFIERTGDTAAALTVLYKVKGTAVAGVDYKPLPGTATIPAGASKVKVKIKPLDDPVAGVRKAKIKLLPATDGSYTVGEPAAVKIKVIDND